MHLADPWDAEAKQKFLLQLACSLLVLAIVLYKAVKGNWFNDRTLLQASIIVIWWANYRLETICPVDLELGDLAYDDIVLPYPEDYVEPEHLMHRWQRESEVRTMVIAHRGGYWGPENSWKSMKKAIELDSEGLEFDVSNTLIFRGKTAHKFFANLIWMLIRSGLPRMVCLSFITEAVMVRLRFSSVVKRFGT